MKENYKLLKNISNLATGTALSSVLSLINLAILTKAIGLESNGAIFLAQSYIGFFNTLLNFQAYEGIIKFLPMCMNKDQEKDKGKNYIKLAILLDISTALFAFILAILLLDIVSGFFNWSAEVIAYTKILIPTILFTITGSITGILRVYGKFNYIAINKSSNSIITFIIYLVGYCCRFNVLYYVYSFFIIQLIVTIISTIMTYITLKQQDMHHLNFRQLKWDNNFIKFTITTNIASTLDLPVTHLLPIIINKYLGLTEISVYKILEKLGGIVSIAVGVISQVISPEISKKISNNDIKGAFNMYYTLKKLVIIAGGVAILGVMITKDWWLGIFIEDYYTYMLVVYLYLIYIVFNCAFSGQHPLFIFSGFEKYNIYILLVVNSVYLFLVVYMTKNMGLSGLILSRIIQASFIFTIKGIILKKLLYSKMISLPKTV